MIFSGQEIGMEFIRSNPDTSYFLKMKEQIYQVCPIPI